MFIVGFLFGVFLYLYLIDFFISVNFLISSETNLNSSSDILSSFKTLDTISFIVLIFEEQTDIVFRCFSNFWDIDLTNTPVTTLVILKVPPTATSEARQVTHAISVRGFPFAEPLKSNG